MAQKTEYELLLEMAAKLDPSYRTAMENARKGVKDVGDSAEESANDLGVMDIALGNLVANGITALVGAAQNAVMSLYNLAEETREFRQDMATLETAFDEAGFSADTATDTWKDLYAVFGEDDRAVEAANNISRMADNEEELADWVKITTGIWGTYQDALPVESLAEAASESAKTGTVVSTLADALNWSSEAAEMFAGYMSEDVVTAEDAFNEALAECNTEAERQALINDTLLKLYGSAADKYEETAAGVMSLNEAQADYNVTQAEMAEKIEPVTVAVKQGLTNLMIAGMQLFANVDFAAWAGKIEGGFSWFINTGLPAIKSGLGWVKDNGANIAIVAGTIGAAFGAIKAGMMIHSGIQAFQTARLQLAMFSATSQGATLAQAALNGTLKASEIITGVLTGKIKLAALAQGAMTAAQNALNAAMKANPIGLIITGITLLIGAFMLLWNNCEGFRNFWIGLWDGLKATVTGGINGIISMLNWFIGKINNISVSLPDWDILGEYAGKDIGFSVPQIPMLAKGGIATGPTLAMVGEGNESEAIMPLSKLGSLVSSTESASIVYSPNITVMPGANGADVKSALDESFEQFKTYMDRYLREKKRTQFS